MSVSGEAEAWREEIARAIRFHIDASDFATLLELVESADPTIVANVLEQKAKGGDDRASRLLKTAVSGAAASPVPIAHPLDFDWRFTEQTNALIVERLAALVPVGGAIGFFGAPTSWRASATMLADRRCVLIDRNAGRHSGGEKIAHDLLREKPPQLRLDAAVVDPPWYPEYHDAFLAAAAWSLGEDGVVLASFPPPLTRPGVLAERRSIVANAVRAALVVVDEAPLALRYQTPPFESAAFAAAGIGLPEAWRRGDLLTFRKKSAAAGAASVHPLAGEAGDLVLAEANDDRWTIFVCDEIPVAVRADGPAVGGELLKPAVPGATLTSVSRRHPARSGAALWSSRNRVYTSSAPAVIATIVAALARAEDPVDAVGDSEFAQESISRTANEIRELLQRERREHGL
jgi:hypothetical protein